MLNGKLRLAKKEDTTKLSKEVYEFILNEMPDPGKPSLDVVTSTVGGIISREYSEGIGILWEVDGEIKGFILGVVSPSIFSEERIATEVAYYVKPEYRKSKAYQDLLSTYESWAKEIARVDTIVLSLMDLRVGKLYERKGYTLGEVSYKKGI